MTDDPRDLEEVQRRLDEIQNRKRGGMRWGMSRHTAERAIEAIEAMAGPDSDAGRSVRSSGSKQRRRKRRKRLL